MTAIASGAKSVINGSVRLLNQPVIKEGVKNVAGSVTFVFGLFEIYRVYQSLRSREASEIDLEVTPTYVQTANKVVSVTSSISLILSAGVSRPGVFLISSLAGKIFSTGQLERVFGPNTLFAVNPWHPRHVLSIAAVAMALPSLALLCFKGFDWGCKKIRQLPPTENRQTDIKIQLMVLFNTITSRPILHLGNQLGRLLRA